VGGREIVYTALGRRLHRAQHLSALRGSPQIGAPLPIFLLDHAEASLEDPLSAARLVGWRYPIVGGASPGLAYLREDAGDLKFAGIADGQLPERLLEAAVLADDNFGSRPERFQPRLLEIPSLRICGLWLCGSERHNFFILLENGQRRGSWPLQIERSIQPAITTALAGLRLRSSAARVLPQKEKKVKTADVRFPIFLLTILAVVVAFGASQAQYPPRFYPYPPVPTYPYAYSYQAAPPQQPPPPTVDCYTSAGQCVLPAPVPSGSTCTCYSPFGTYFGVAR
jgi:hypothetical protein